MDTDANYSYVPNSEIREEYRKFFKGCVERMVNSVTSHSLYSIYDNILYLSFFLAKLGVITEEEFNRDFSFLDRVIYSWVNLHSPVKPKEEVWKDCKQFLDGVVL